MRRGIYLCTVILLSGCVTMQTRQVADVTEADTIILTKTASQGPVYAVLIIGSGEIDGEGEISLILDGEAYLTEMLSGEVAFRWDTDWYADEAEIRYIPASASSGDLILRYRFQE
jgi:hypothetical protein